MSVYLLYDSETGEIAHVHVAAGDRDPDRERLAGFVAGRLDPVRLGVASVTEDELARGIGTHVDPATGRAQPAAGGGIGARVVRRGGHAPR